MSLRFVAAPHPAVLSPEALLEQSMNYRNVSDVPVSLAMSGGLDSSLNLYYSQKVNKDLRGIKVQFILFI